MIWTMLRVMALGLFRDRGALIMAFLLPPAIFMIFAAIFASASGDDIRLRVALTVPQPSEQTSRLEAALRSEPSLRILDQGASSEAEVMKRVRSGEIDAALVLGPDLRDTASAPAIILVEPAKLLAGAILSGQVQRLIALEMPDIALSRSVPTMEAVVGGFSPEQSQRLAAAVQQLAMADPGEEAKAGLVSIRQVGVDGNSNANVAYYAGGVAILFLLFSAMQHAATLIEERRSGIVDRLAVGPAGTEVAVIGKFLFLTLLGVVQVGIIFAVAALVYGVDVLSHFGLWLLATVAAAMAAAGVGLAVAAICTTRQQSHTVATFIVLVSSAIGGSMVPRFMMPPWLQDIGWYTPNAWAIEAYHGVLRRGEGFAEMVPELASLVGLAGAAVLAALVISRLRLKL